MTTARIDKPTLCAAAVLAMCATTFSHEALGHAGACLASGAAVEHLSSAIFRCARPSPLVDAAGPLTNLVVGMLAWAAATRVRAPAPRLLLALIGAFSGFWEGGYALKAMLLRDGDLYFGLAGAFGQVPVAARILAAAMGIGLYVMTLRLARSMLGAGTARTAWLAATLAALLAALANSRDLGLGLRDAGLEIGLASAPLIWIGGDGPSQDLARDRALIAVAAVVFAAFVLTLGRGLPWPG